MIKWKKQNLPPPPVACPLCGKQVPAERWVCPHCGAPLYQALDSQASYQPRLAREKPFRVSIPLSQRRSLTEGIEQLPPPRSISPYILLETALVLFTLLVLGFLAWRWLNQRNTEKETALPTAASPIPAEAAYSLLPTTSTAEANPSSFSTSQPLFLPIPKDIEKLPQVTVVPLSGSGLIQVTNSANLDYSPNLSRDQKHFVYTSKINGHWQIIEADPQSGKFIRQITQGEIDYYTPQFNEDGTQLLVVANWSVNLDIFLISFENGKVLRQLTFDSAADYAPAWLRDYSGFVFTSHRDGNAEIYRMKIPKAQTSEPAVERLTDDPAFDGYPSISYSGNEMVFYSDRAEPYNYDIYLLSFDNLIPRRLTNDPARDASPVFSPGDSWVVFESNRSGNYEIYAIRPTAQDELSLKNLTYTEGNDYMPYFSPDGLWLYFLSDLQRNMDIYRRPYP